MGFIDIIASFFAAVLAAMGVGGGGLLVIYLIFVLNMPQLSAQGINLIFFLCASVCSLPFHIKSKRVSFKTAAVFAPAGAIGAYFGCKTALVSDPIYVRLAFGWLITVAGTITLIKCFIPTLTSIRGQVLRMIKNRKKKKENL